MMKKEIKILLAVFLVLIFLISAYIGVGNMKFFELHDVSVNINGRKKAIPEDVQNIIASEIGTNLFKINLSSLKNRILKCEGITDVAIKRFFPDRLIIDLRLTEFLIRVRSENGFCLCRADGLVPVTEDKYLSFGDLNEVFVRDDYVRFLTEWGYDEGFGQMLELASRLDSKFLITEIKYDNNNNDKFGRMFLYISRPEAELCVREPVTYGRLEESLLLITEDGQYDLYANALVKRI